MRIDPIVLASVAILSAAVLVAVVQGAWNGVAPSVSGMRRLSYFQAFALTAGILCVCVPVIVSFFLIAHGFG